MSKIHSAADVKSSDGGVLFGVLSVIIFLGVLLSCWAGSWQQSRAIHKEASDLGLIRYECDPQTGRTTAYWIVPDSASGFSFKKVEVK